MKLVLILMFLFFSIKGFSTYQVEDYLIFNNDTLYFSNSPKYISSPLEQISNISRQIDKYREFEFISSGCWRGFYAEWKIIDNTLFLSKVFDCATNEIINKTIEKILKRKFANGLLKADWVSGTFLCGKDVDVAVMQLYMSSYLHNYKLQIDKGKIVNVECYQEKKTCEIIFAECNETSKDKIYVYAAVEIPPQFNNKSAEAGFREYVEKNLKDFDGVQARIFVEFIIEGDGSISNVKLLRGADQLLDEEALRVVNSSPKWTPGKVRGETVRVKYIYPVVFNHYRTNW